MYACKTPPWLTPYGCPPPLPSLVQAWLNAKIHRVGSLYNSGDELMRAATGSELDPAIFLAYLKSKYTELYKL